MRSIDRALGVGAALAATMALVWGSTIRMTPHASRDGVLRLAWTARPERVEDCRSQSEEALEKLPPHMRQAVVCEGTTASYRLQVRRAGTLILDQVVRGGGLRHDRPLYVFRDIPLPPGEVDVAVRFDRIDPKSAAAPRARASASDEDRSRHDDAAGDIRAIDPERRRREGEERLRELGEAAPASLSLERRFRFDPREVILVSYDAGRRELVVIDEPSR